jgi:hypothetical protein
MPADASGQSPSISAWFCAISSRTWVTTSTRWSGQALSTPSMKAAMTRLLPPAVGITTSGLPLSFSK